MTEGLNQPAASANEQPEIAGVKKDGSFAVHLSFIIALLMILLLKYAIYFASEVTGTGLNPGRIGATLSHLLMWAFAYAMCCGAYRKLKFGIIAAVSLFFGVLTVPLLGWIGIIVMFVLYRKEKKQLQSESEITSQDIPT